MLHCAYRGALFCRQCLGIQKLDFREGAPESIDTAKALKCAELADAKIPYKEIARKLGFRIYSVDNPSGTYPLFRKYLKKGREIRMKLNDLDQFLRDTINSLLVELKF